jgi:hypothetical protein
VEEEEAEVRVERCWENSDFEREEGEVRERR